MHRVVLPLEVRPFARELAASLIASTVHEYPKTSGPLSVAGLKKGELPKLEMNQNRLPLIVRCG